jgi:hypothetical protein
MKNTIFAHEWGALVYNFQKTSHLRQFHDDAQAYVSVDFLNYFVRLSSNYER